MEALKRSDDSVPVVGTWKYHLTRTRWECGCTADIEERVDGNGGGAIFSHCEEHKFGQGRPKEAMS